MIRLRRHHKRLDLVFAGGMNVGKYAVETKFLRLKTPVTLGSLFGEWRVCWLGGWCKNRLGYVVMLCRVAPQGSRPGIRPLSKRAGPSQGAA